MKSPIRTKTLYLIGTIHQDLHGPERLEYILEKVSPQIIALEFSEDRAAQSSQRFSKKKVKSQIKKEVMQLNDKWDLSSAEQRTLTQIGVARLSIIGYEFFCTHQYVRAHQETELKYIDLSMESPIAQITQSYQLLYQELLEVPNYISRFKRIVRAGAAKLLKEEEANLENEYNTFKRRKETLRERINRECPGIDENNPLIQKYPQLLKLVNEVTSIKREQWMAQKIRDAYCPTKKIVAICGVGHLYLLAHLLSDLHPYTLHLNDYKKI